MNIVKTECKQKYFPWFCWMFDTCMLKWWFATKSCYSTLIFASFYFHESKKHISSYRPLLDDIIRDQLHFAYLNFTSQIFEVDRLNICDLYLVQRVYKVCSNMHKIDVLFLNSLYLSKFENLSQVNLTLSRSENSIKIKH